jgi:hypothetical protein
MTDCTCARDLIDRLDRFQADFEAWRSEMTEWREAADALIERNRCLDIPLQTALIELAEQRQQRQRAAELLEKRRAAVTRWALTIAAIVAVMGMLWAVFQFAVQQAGG